MKLFNAISIRRKILGLAIIVAIGLAAILWVGNSALTATSERLTQIQQVYYPVLARSTSNAQQLERMAESFSTAVTIGELDSLTLTDELLAAMEEAFAIQRERLPESAATINNLANQTRSYHQQAKMLASGLIDGSLPVDQVQASAAAANDKLVQLKNALNQFQSESESAFTSLVETTNHQASQTRLTNRIIGAIVLLLVGFGAYAIATNISASVLKVANSLEAIAHGDGDLTVRLYHDGQDELALLVNAFNLFIGKLRDSIRSTIDSVSQLRQTTQQLAVSSGSATAQIVAQGTAIEQTTTALSEMF